MADEKTVLQYKGRPLMRKYNMIYYGSMADSHIVSVLDLFGLKNLPSQRA